MRSLHTLSSYKKISSLTVSGPGGPGVPGTCHRRSDSCCVTLKPCDLQVSLRLTGSPSTPQLSNNKPCLRRLNLHVQDKNTRVTGLRLGHSHATAQGGIEAEGGCEVSPEWWCDRINHLLFVLLFGFVLSFWVLLQQSWEELQYSSLGSSVLLLSSYLPKISSHQSQPSQWQKHTINNE